MLLKGMMTAPCTLEKVPTCMQVYRDLDKKTVFSLRTAKATANPMLSNSKIYPLAMREFAWQ